MERLGKIRDMEKIGEHFRFESEYELYKRVHGSDLLTAREFVGFWQCISEKERHWFLEQFASGEPVLTREMFDADSGFRAVMNDTVRPEIKALVEAELNQLDLSYWAK
jgi:hypothetical protein